MASGDEGRGRCALRHHKRGEGQPKVVRVVSLHGPLVVTQGLLECKEGPLFNAHLRQQLLGGNKMVEEKTRALQLVS